MPDHDTFDAGFLAAILDHIAHPVFVKDRQFRFVFLNRALCTMVGHPLEKMLGKADYDFFPKKESDFFRQKDTEMFETGREVEIGEESITDASGSRHVLSTTKVPLKNERGEVTHLVGIIHDITRLKDAEDQLRAVNEQLEQRVADRTRQLADAQQELLRKERLAVLGRLVGGLAHQIRNPLGAIINAAYILNRTLGPGTSPDALKSVEIIHQEVWRANRIILDLLDYARIRPPEPQPYPVSELAKEVVSEEEVPASIEVKYEIEAGLSVLADRDQTEGALRNLVRNALEAMPTGGTLILSGRAEGPQVVIAVEDTGKGIAPEVQAHLFDPLVTTKPLGLGLGLTTARSLVENQGGSISSFSVLGEGTRFEVRLPIAEGK